MSLSRIPCRRDRLLIGRPGCVGSSIKLCWRWGGWTLVHLERLGIVRELTVKRRNRLYSYENCQSD